MRKSVATHRRATSALSVVFPVPCAHRHREHNTLSSRNVPGPPLAAQQQRRSGTQHAAITAEGAPVSQ